MGYVQRDQAGKIVAWSRHPSSERQEWVADSPDSTPVPPVITKLQAKRALVDAGLYEAFQTALASASDDTKEDYGLAVELRRDDPLVVQFGLELGMDDAALDSLFRAAALL